MGARHGARVSACVSKWELKQRQRRVSRQRRRSRGEAEPFLGGQGQGVTLTWALPV